MSGPRPTAPPRRAARHLAGVAIASGLGLALALAGTPACVAAQTGAGEGYLFHSPRAAFSLHLGVARPSADSKVFSFASEQLTLNRGDFTAFNAGADLDITIVPRVALQLGTSFSTRAVSSNYRDFVDNDDQEIEQSTTFRRAPVTAGVKVYLTSPGRQLGRFAWVPSKLTPYVGAGGGLMYYSFRQSGDFVDFTDFGIFGSTLESSGWASTAYGSAGLNYTLSARVGLVTEARYDRANAPMSSDFIGFDHIDLSGFSVTTGFHFRF